MGKSSLLTIAFIIVFIAGCEKEKKEFTSREPQQAENRLIKGALTAIDSLTLSDLNIYSVNSIKTNKTHLFIADGSDMKMVAINKEDFSSYYSIDFSEGRGPRELLHLTSFDVNDSSLVIVDERQQKRITYKLPDVFEEEILFENMAPHRIEILDSDTYVHYSPFIGSSFLFNITNASEDNSKRFEKLRPGQGPFIYEGFIRALGDYIYFAGFSEPLLKKYSIDGDLIYSVGTIDNFNTEANYVVTEDGKTMGYTPAAQFSTLRFDIFNDYWTVIPAGDGNSNYNYLDLYNTENGNYISTYKIPKNNTARIQVDDKRIYTIARSEGVYKLVIYKNILS